MSGGMLLRTRMGSSAHTVIGCTYHICLQRWDDTMGLWLETVNIECVAMIFG